MTDSDPRVMAAARSLAGYNYSEDAWPDFVDQAKAALEAADRAAWRDISSAPTARNPEERRVIVYGGIPSEVRVVLPDGDWWNSSEGAALKAIPKGWQPLPPLPSEDSET